MKKSKLVSDNIKTKTPLRLRHILAIIFLVNGTIIMIVFHYLNTGDIIMAIIEGLTLLPLEILFWRLWMKRWGVAEKKAEVIRIQELREPKIRKENPISISMTPPISKTHIVLSGIAMILFPIILYLIERGTSSLILLLFMLPFGIMAIISVKLIGKLRFIIDSFGIRRTRILLRDFYLPWYQVRKITVKDMSSFFIPLAKNNYIFMAITDKGKKKILMSSLAIGEDKFTQLYYGIIPFLKNRRIEFDDELKWASSSA